jgi:sec-independent protein translocase protein TatA
MFNSVLLFMNIGGPEMILIFLVVLLLFGGKKLPELARGLGKGLREFKDASDGIKREIHNMEAKIKEADETILTLKQRI